MMLVAVAAMGFACAQETTEVAPEKQTKTITVNCDITRVAFNDDNSALTWSEGDTIGAYTDDGDVNVESSAFPEAFTLEVSADASEVYAYYPYYSGNSSKAATAMSIGIKDTIEQSEAGKVTTLGAIPMVAVGEIYGSTVDLFFEPYACVLAYNVYGGESSTEKVTSIKLTSDAKSSGYDYEFDLTDCDVREYTPAYDYTQVNLTGNAQFVPNGTKPAGVSANAVFMPVAKQVYGAGSTIVVTTTEDTYTFTATGDINCNQGYATLNLNLAKAEKASENMPEIAEGDYILAVKSGEVYYAMAGTNADSSNRMDQVEITSIFDTESITTNDETLVWTITKTTGGYLFEYDSKYLYGSSSSNHGKIGNSTDNVITLEDNGDGTYTVRSSVAGSERALARNHDSGGFAFYQNSTLTGNNASKYSSNFYIVPVSFIATPSIEVDSNVTISADASEGTVDVTTKYVDGDIEVSYEDVDWFAAEMNEEGKLYYNAEANESTEENRSVVVTLTYGEASATVTFTQLKKDVSGGDKETVEVVYDFTNISGFSSWTSSYMEHTVDYDDATVTFVKANKQSGTITNMPVTKGNDVTLVAKNGATITSAKFECAQWTTKAQTITLHYSLDGGSSYNSTGVTSSNFTIEKNDLPTGTNAVKITFSSTGNQVGIKSATITFEK